MSSARWAELLQTCLVLSNSDMSAGKTRQVPAQLFVQVN